MLFNSMTFAVFVTLVFLLYWNLPKYQWVILLIASYCFYMGWGIKYAVLILIVTALSYISAIYIEKEQHNSKRKMILIMCICCILGNLIFFKYTGFLNHIFGFTQFLPIQVDAVISKIVLPIGISFYSFQALSYVIDVYRRKQKAVYHFGKYAAFISFFCTISSGPIERVGNILPQIHNGKKFDYEQASYGIKQMAWGFFKKLVIAGNLCEYTDLVYNNVSQYRGASLLIIMFFYSIQIYCDFSGYSDIAIGTAKLFGVNLMDNFKSPYFSTSVKEFWSRWHISLSTWFRDYVYIPLGGNRVSRQRNMFNLLITFLLSGLWHGANWTFLIWGGIHGIAQIIEKILSPIEKKTGRIRKILFCTVTFIFCSVAWVFFRADSISDAIYLLSHMIDGIMDMHSYFILGYKQLDIAILRWTVIIFSCCILFAFDFYSLKSDVIVKISGLSNMKRWLCYIIFILAIIFLMPIESSTEFIYFKF